MSITQCEQVEIAELLPHPNADRLELVKVMGTQCVVPKGQYSVGDRVVWIPPDMLISDEAADRLGVRGYLKPAIYPGDFDKTYCRVGACRIRGEASFGIVTNFGSAYIGDNLDALFGAHKYEPPLRNPRSGSDGAPSCPVFHKYTDIENFYRYPNAIEEGAPVRMTEKIHGMNCRLGLVKYGSDFELMAGSHNIRLKSPPPNTSKAPVFWECMTPDIIGLLEQESDGKHNVMLFGEVFGLGIQDMDYGCSEPIFRVFDMSVNGKYVNFSDLLLACLRHDVPMVPLLYKGPFSRAVMEDCTDGPTYYGGVRSKFKGREGVVVTPLTETYSDVMRGRLILKSVSADYLDRKNAEDN